MITSVDIARNLVSPCQLHFQLLVTCIIWHNCVDFPKSMAFNLHDNSVDKQPPAIKVGEEFAELTHDHYLPQLELVYNKPNETVQVSMKAIRRTVKLLI